MFDSQSSFLHKLQAEASLQARLHEHRFVPPQLDWLTSFIGRYAWQVILVLSLATAIALEVL